MLRVFLKYCVFCLLVVACNNTVHQHNHARTIDIKNIKNQVIALNTIFNTKVLPLHSDSSGYFANIKDVVVASQSIYILNEATGSVAKFNRHTGTLEQEICRQGRGASEYLQPTAISADSNHIYLLDVAGLAIYEYSLDLQNGRKIYLGFPALDFIRTSDGFLCYNLATSEKQRQVVYVDHTGEIKESYGKSEVSNTMLSGSNLFFKDNIGNIYCVLPSERVVYQWDESNHQLLSYMNYDFGNYNYLGDATVSTAMNGNYAIPSEFFKIDSLSIRSFLFSENRYYDFNSSSWSSPQTGLVEDKQGNIPFYPRWQAGDMLIGTYSPNEIEDTLNTEKDFVNGERLILFTLKQE